jgi:hypothetical protein
MGWGISIYTANDLYNGVAFLYGNFGDDMTNDAYDKLQRVTLPTAYLLMILGTGAIILW